MKRLSGKAGRRDRASAFEWAVPLRWTTLNVNSLRNKPQRANFGVALGVFKYCKAEWLVTMVKCWPRRYDLNLERPKIMANNSPLVREYHRSCLLHDFDAYSMTISCPLMDWCSIVEMVSMDQSVYSRRGWSASGMAKTGPSIRADLRSWKAASHSAVHIYLASFFRSWNKGATVDAKWEMKAR